MKNIITLGLVLVGVEFMAPTTNHKKVTNWAIIVGGQNYWGHMSRVPQ